MATLAELIFKAQSGKATSSDFEELAKLSKAQADEQKNAEKAASTLIDTIKKAKISPQALTSILANEGLIILPETKTATAKTVIFESDKMKFEGNDRETSFKVWAGRKFAEETDAVKKKWAVVQAKGKEYFLSKLTAEGTKYYETDEGKKYIDGLFA